jgi:hypothetical protein
MKLVILMNAIFILFKTINKKNDEKYMMVPYKIINVNFPVLI